MMVSIIEIALYTKPTAEHQYRVLRSSCHPLHTKRAFPFSLALRIRRICSSNETYNLGLLNQEIQRFHTITHTHSSDSPTRIPLVVGYHPAIRSISSMFHKHIYILSSAQLCATLFKYVPLVTFLRTNKPETRYVDSSPSEPELSINVVVLYTVQSPLFFGKIVEKERYRQPFLPGLA